MGLFTNIGEKFSNTIWGSVNSAVNSIAESTNSFLYPGGAVLNTGVSSDGMGQFSEFSNSTYFDYLKNYHFVDAILNILCSCLKDAIIKSDFHVQITGDEDATKRANQFIDEIQLKQFILDNLRDMVYRGVYAFGIDYEKRKLYALDDPFSCNIMTNTKDIVGYDINGKTISTDSMICYYYQLRYVTSLGSKQNDNKNNPYSIVNNTEKFKTIEDYRNETGIFPKRDDSNIPLEISDLVVKFKKYEPYGLFDRSLFRIFQMHSLEYALWLMSLRESMKPTLLGMSINSGRSPNLANAINMANSVEQILNSPVTGISQVANPLIFMNQLTWTMLNNIRVMPTLDQYQNLSDISQNDSSGKREKLAQELDNVRKEILQELTIPEELFGGGGSRWDQYSRSDRFVTTIDSLLASISILVKQIISKLLGISSVSIAFNIDIASLAASFDVKNKLSQTAERLADLSRIIASFKDIVENDYCVPTAAYEYLRNSVGAIDEKLLPILIANLGQTNDSGGEDSGDSDSSDDDSGGFEL